MEPQGWKTASSLRATKPNRTASLSKTTAHRSRAGCGDENTPAPSRRGNISLDIPFYRTCLCKLELGASGIKFRPKLPNISGPSSGRPHQYPMQKWAHAEVYMPTKLVPILVF